MIIPSHKTSYFHSESRGFNLDPVENHESSNRLRRSQNKCYPGSPTSAGSSETPSLKLEP